MFLNVLSKILEAMTLFLAVPAAKCEFAWRAIGGRMAGNRYRQSSATDLILSSHGLMEVSGVCPLR